MNYTSTDVLLKVENTSRSTKRSCRLVKYTDGAEYMIYKIEGCKKTTEFAFDAEDIDVVDDKYWQIDGDMILYKYWKTPGGGRMWRYREGVHEVINSKYFASTGKYMKFHDMLKNDFRKK